MQLVEIDTQSELRTPDTLTHLCNCVKFLTSQVSDGSRHSVTQTPPQRNSDPYATSLPRTRSTPTSLTGGDRPCSSQPSFRSPSCHWPQAGILPHQIQSPVVQLLSQHPVTHPVLNSAQDHSPVPIPDPETPPPVSTTTQVHSPHSQHESPGLYLIQLQSPAVLDPDSDHSLTRGVRLSLRKPTGLVSPVEPSAFGLDEFQIRSPWPISVTEEDPPV